MNFSNFSNFIESESENPSFLGIELRFSLEWTLVFLLAYFFIFAFGIIGNSLVIYVVVRNKYLRNVKNIFIINLALADLLAWILGWTMCKLASFLQCVSLITSVYTFVAVTCERFLTIQYPLQKFFTKHTAALTIVGIWVLSIIIAYPQFHNRSLVTSSISANKPKLVQKCISIWPSKPLENVYFYVVFYVLVYIFPLAAIFSCFLFIFFRISGRNSSNEPMRKVYRKTNRSVLKMLLTMILCFMCSWLPVLLAYSVLKTSGKPDYKLKLYLIENPVVIRICELITVTHSCVNPVLYNFMNEKFKRAFKNSFSFISRNERTENQAQLDLISSNIFFN